MKTPYLSLFLGLSFLTVVGCSQISPEDSATLTKAKSNFELFAPFGEFHNAMLTYADKNVDVDHPVGSLEEGLDYLASVQAKYTDELDLSVSSKAQIKSYLRTYKNLYNSENFLFLSPSKAETMIDLDTEESFTTDEVYSMINTSYSRGEIDTFEKNAFVSLIDWSVAYTSGHLDELTFVQNVNRLIANWDRRYSQVDYSALIDEEGRIVCEEDVEIPHGALSGVVLNVSRSSLEYWDSYSTRALPLIAAQDIVGAVIGAVSGAAGSAAVGGHVNWGSVAWGAAVGAVTGSTGVVGKVAKFLTKLF